MWGKTPRYCSEPRTRSRVSAGREKAASMWARSASARALSATRKGSELGEWDGLAVAALLAPELGVLKGAGDTVEELGRRA